MAKLIKKIGLLHISGIPTVKENAPCNITIDDVGRKLVFKQFLSKKPETTLSLDKIINVYRDTEEKIQQKSGVGRAIVGGMLFGETGAVVGAVTKKDKIKKLYYIVITFQSNNETKEIVLKENGNGLPAIDNFIKSLNEICGLSKYDMNSPVDL